MSLIEAGIMAGGGAAIAGVFQLIMFFLNRKGAERAALEQILQYDIKMLCRLYIEAGEISVEDLEELMRMHEVYHKLGGNGYLNALMDAVKRLTIKGKGDSSNEVK